MNIPEEIARAKVVVLTGAGASVPLGRFTTRQFLDDFRQSEYQELAADPELVAPLNEVLQEAFDHGFDIEQLLDLLDRRAEAAGLLDADGAFRHRVLQDSPDALRSYAKQQRRLADAVRDKVIRHYSTINGTDAAALYRPLLREYRSWFAQVPDLGFTLPLFTLNYDIAVELAARRLANPDASGDGAADALLVELIDGIVQGADATERRWNRREFERYVETPDRLGVVLVKLHGSVRWGRLRESDRPDEIVELTPGLERNPSGFETAVLYPTLAPKPVEAEPFHTGYRILRACLRTSRLFIIIGTTLRDPEVVSELRDAIEDNDALHVVWVGPHVTHERLHELLGSAPERLAAVRGAFDLPRPDIESSLPGGLLPREWLMGCLRRLAYEAYAVSQVSGGPLFGHTLVCDRTNGLGRVGNLPAAARRTPD